MMAARDTLITDLEQAIQHGTSDKRVETLRRVTDLFLNGAPVFNEEQVGVFDDVILRLSEQIEMKARAELARRLAPVDNAPLETIRSLASDDEVAVAAPVLTQSARLGEDDLVDIARTKGQGHLLAISQRPEVSERITDVLVVRGNREVVHTVASNDGARFSDRGFSALVKRSADDAGLQEVVGLRKDIPPQHYRAILAKATEHVQMKLLAATRSTDEAQVKRLVADVSTKVGEENAPKPRDYSAAQKLIGAIAKTGKLAETELAAFAKAGKFEETLCALSTLCGVPIDVAERLVLGERPDPILILAKAAGFSWPTVKAIILVRPGAAGSSQAGIEEAFGNFERLSPATAQRVMRFWQVRQTTLR